MTGTASEDERLTVVLTGASSGIGKAAAKMLAQAGLHVIGLGRDPGRSEAALAEIRACAPDARIDMVVADLSVMADVVRAADKIASITSSVHLLLNNAGGIGSAKVVTAEGNEAIFAGNHLGHFLLTRKLLPLLRTARANSDPGLVRIVNVSSSASDLSHGLDWTDLQSLHNHHAATAYCNVKLANLLFTRELSKRLTTDGILVNAMHPGVVATNFASYGDDELQAAFAGLKEITVSPEQAAGTLVWLATDPAIAGRSGEYFHERQPTMMNPLALDDRSTERLWIESEISIDPALLGK